MKLNIFPFCADSNIPHMLYGDETRIRQSVLNILSNAVKFTETGFVSLSVTMEFSDKEKINLIFEVTDTGTGSIFTITVPQKISSNEKPASAAASPVPIIALTANAVSGMMEMFLENGFNFFLSKPIDTVKMNSILEKWIPKNKKFRLGGVIHDYFS